jgi:hypothetical protein
MGNTQIYLANAVVSQKSYTFCGIGMKALYMTQNKQGGKIIYVLIKQYAKRPTTSIFCKIFLNLPSLKSQSTIYDMKGERW